jgi:hypothetical protein
MTTFTSNRASTTYARWGHYLTIPMMVLILVGIDALGRTVGLGFFDYIGFGSALTDAVTSIYNGIASLFTGAEPASSGQLIEVAS